MFVENMALFSLYLKKISKIRLRVLACLLSFTFVACSEYDPTPPTPLPIVVSQEQNSLGIATYMALYRYYMLVGGKTLDNQTVQLLFAPPGELPWSFNRGANGQIGSNWCTEGYVKALAEAGYTSTESITSHKTLVNHFKLRKSLIPLNNATLGDYLEIDSNNDGIANHSGMYIGMHHKTGQVLTLEANAHSNTIDYMLRDISQITNVGCVDCLPQSQHLASMRREY